MKRFACAVLVLAGTGCFDFEQRLAACRDANGAWICGDAGLGTDAGLGDAGTTDGGGTDAGTEDAGVNDAGTFPLPDRTGLICQQGWCWEHPRPSGMELKTLWARSRNDLWVGGEGGVLAHWDGTSWTSHSLARDLTIKSICGHEGDVYVGMGLFASGTSTERLLRYRGGQWEDLSANVGEVTGLSCGSRLLVVDWSGLVEMPWSAEMFTRRYTTVFDEICNAVVELSPTECLFSCHEAGAGGTFTRIHRCDGSLELDFRDGGSDGSRIEALWVDPTRGPLASVGNANEVIQRDGGWQTLFSGTVTQNFFAAASSNNRSIAVGSYGSIIDLTSSSIDESQFQAEDNGYLRGVTFTDAGVPMAVGEWGCIIERNGTSWSRLNECDMNILDVSFGARLLALTDRGVYERTPQGWRLVQALSDARLGMRVGADGGLVFLSESALFANNSQFPLGSNDARYLELTGGGTRAVISREGGELLEIVIATNTRRTLVADSALGRPIVDERGGLWVRASDGGVHVSQDGGAFVRERVGDGGVLEDLSTGPGRMWALRGNVVAWRDLGSPGWNEVVAPREFTRLVPVSADEVLLISGTNADDQDALLINTIGGQRPVAASPTELTGPFFSRGGEAWLVGYNGGLLRFKAP